MLGVFAEFERSMIDDPGAGQGGPGEGQGGRKAARAAQGPADEDGIRQAVADGLSIRRTAKRFGVSPAKVQRVLIDEAPCPAA
jgi:DNA invertase Pin-like site-specific DNA recombinase